MKSALELLFLTLVGGVLFFYGAADRPITRSSEGRVARVAQEMLDSGDWIVPRLNGEVRKEKPPLSSWAVALTTLAAGSRQVTPLHAYIPTGVAGILLALLIYVWLRRTEAPNEQGSAPFFAALIALTAPGFLLQARSAELDLLLALFVTLAFFGFWLWRVEGLARGLLLCYAALGLAVLTKGHVGLIVFLPGVLAWHFVERARGALSQHTRSGLWHLAGVVILLGIVLPWGIPFLQNSGIAWSDFQKEGLDRFGKDAHHYEPPYFYLLNVPGWLLPWFLMLPPALYVARALPPDARSPLRRLCVCWFLTSFVIFSIISAKQRHYALPFLPPLALLIADATRRWQEHPVASVAAGARKTFAGILLLLGIALLALPVVMDRRGLLDAADARGVWLVAVLGTLLFFASAWKTLACVRCQTLLAAACVCATVAFARTDEKAELEESPVAFCARVRALVPRDQPLYDYNVALAKKVWRAQVLFYLGRIVERGETPLPELLKKPGVYVLTSDKWLADVPKERYEVLVLEEKFLKHKPHAYLIRSKP